MIVSLSFLFSFIAILPAILCPPKNASLDPEKWILFIDLCHEKSKSYCSVSIRRLLLHVRGTGSQLKFQEVLPSGEPGTTSGSQRSSKTGIVLTGRDLEQTGRC